MNRRTKFFLALGLVCVFAIVFALVVASPRRRIPRGSIVLLDRSLIEPVDWLVLSNATTKRLMVLFGFGQYAQHEKQPFQYNPTACVDEIVAPSGVVRLAIRNPPLAPGDVPMVTVGEELAGVERIIAAARVWTWRLPGGSGFSRNPFANQHRYLGHYTDITRELLNRSTNGIAEIHR